MANGTLKVSNIQTSSGSGTITVGASGETVDFSNGTITLNSSMKNTPAFCALNTSGQTGISSGSTTKLTFDSEDFDTDSAFDLTNNRFTVPSGEAGKYFFGIEVVLQATSGSGYFSHGSAFLYKNGSNFAQMGRADDRSDNQSREWAMDGSIIVDAAASDYFEVYAVVYTDSGTWLVNHGDKGHRFFGYKLIT